MRDGVNYGDPFLLQVDNGNLSGRMGGNEDFGCFEAIDQEANFIRQVGEEVQEFGCSSHIYVCIPVAHIWTDDPGDPNDSTNAPNRVVTIEHAGTNFERMALAAIAMGKGS